MWFWKMKPGGGGGGFLLPAIWRQGEACGEILAPFQKSGERALFFRFPLLSFLVGQVRKMGSGN